MAAPRQVRKASRQADKLHEEVYTAADADTADGDPASEAVEPEATAFAAEDGAATPAPEAPAAPVVAEADPVEVEDFEQKYKVLQGKYNAEVPRYARELRDLKDQLESQTSILAGLENIRNEPAPVAPQVSGSSSISQEEIDDYGPEFFDIVARQASLAMSPQLAEIKQQLQQMNSGMGNVAQRLQQTDQERVHAYLDNNVPSWQQLNDDDGFLTWLEQVDRFTGQSRRKLLTEAYQQHDAPRVAAFFTSYQEENAAVTPASEPSPQPDTGPAKVPLSQFVAPGAPRESGTADAQDGKQTWTQAQIAAFYRDVQSGKYRGDARQADKHKIEKDIVAAGREGRIIG